MGQHGRLGAEGPGRLGADLPPAAVAAVVGDVREPIPFDELVASGKAQTNRAALYSAQFGHDRAIRKKQTQPEALKARLEREVPDRLRRYAVEWDSANQTICGLETWRKLVFEDLWRALDEDSRNRVRLAPKNREEAELSTIQDYLEQTRRFCDPHSFGPPGRAGSKKNGWRFFRLILAAIRDALVPMSVLKPTS